MHSLLPILLLGLSSLVVKTTNGDGRIYINDCPSDTSNSPGSAFQHNLDALLSSLPGAAVASSGFAKNITGAAPDQAYGLAQCRGDVNASDCRTCLDASVRDVNSKCPGQKSAMVIYDACLLRYSNASFFGVLDRSLTTYLCSWQNDTQPVQSFFMQFGVNPFDLMVNLTATAAFKSSHMFAAGMVQVTPSLKLYGMVQCTRDLTAGDCNSCLSAFIPAMPYYCDGKSIRMLGRSCYARLEVYPFYNAQAAEAAMLPAPVNSATRHANHSDAIACLQSILLAILLAI